MGLLLLAGCTAAPAQDSGWKTCDQVACEGTLDGAAYEVRMPQNWNGTLLIWSHGYRSAQPVPPDFAPVDTTAQVAPDDDVASALLKQGYALAGSSYASNGWAVADGVRAGEGLYDYVRTNIGQPQRVYVWGASLGGLITAELAERHPEWVSGAAPMCGVLAGIVPNFDLSLDVAYAVRELFDPSLPLQGFSSYEQAVRSLETAAKAIQAAAKKPASTAAAELLAINAIAGGPSQTSREDGSTPASRVRAAAEAVLTALAFATGARYEVEQRFGGPISDNTDTDYTARFTAAARAEVDAVSPGASARVLAALAGGARSAADPAAVEKARADGGDPSGRTDVPTFTVHTAADPLVIVANESFFAARHERAGGAGGLAQAVTVAPAHFTGTAPYGAGHCNFTDGTYTGTVDVLDAWVRGGVAPTPAGIATAFGRSGYDPDFVVPAWPDLAVR